MSTYSAINLSRGWLSACVASGNDEERPALHKTVCLELFPRGLRLVATDSYILMASWVPNIEHADEPEPEADEAPVAIATAIDPHGRAKGFFGHLLKLAEQADKDGAPIPEVRVQLGVVESDPDANNGTFEGMEATYVIVEHPDHERLKLQAYEGEFPQWQKLFAAFKGEKTIGIGLNPDLVVRLAKAAKIHHSTLVWRFGGQHKMALVEVDESYPRTYGAAMPLRLNADLSMPEPEGVE